MAENGLENPGLLARFRVKAERYRAQLESLKRDMEELKGKLEATEREREEFRTKADSSIHAKELERMKSEIRSVKHRHAFEAIAREAGANPKAIDDVFAASGWKAETDEVDMDAMKAAVESLKEQKDYYFSGSSAAESKSVKPAPGSGKGAPVLGGGPVISEDLAANDPGYAMRNWDKISKFYRDKLDIVE